MCSENEKKRAPTFVRKKRKGVEKPVVKGKNDEQSKRVWQNLEVKTKTKKRKKQMEKIIIKLSEGHQLSDDYKCNS